MKKYLLVSILIMFYQNALPQSTAFNTGTIGVDMNLYGRIQLFQPDTTGPLNLYSLSVLVGTSPSSVFDYWQDAGIQDSTTSYYDSVSASFRLYGSFNNSYSNLPPNVLVKTYVTGWPGSSYVLIKYVIINKDSLAINALPGLEIISQMDGLVGFDTVKYIDSSAVLDIYKNNHLGFKLFTGNLNSIISFEYFDGYEKDSSYYKWMTHDTLETQYNSGTEGPVTIISQDFQNINPGDSITLYYGMALGSSFSDVINGLDSSFAKYNSIITSIPKQNGSSSPLTFSLYQNYPNPFNPSTIISFTLPEKSRVSLKVYDILGRVVDVLADGVMDSGIHKINFNGNKLASGIYFYSLSTDKGNIISRKMVLLK
ncbi:MAG: T9SS type A sorting domain-containing protein [Ignavibacteriaceae bacterium]|nr:T9SS type A sorting domain-containing protein [Ignavibacteriaceae bacterium]